MQLVIVIYAAVARRLCLHAASASLIAWQDLRVRDQACALQDIDAAVRTYHYLSERWFTHASPTLFNAGTPRPQLSSCFLIAMKARA